MQVVAFFGMPVSGGSARQMAVQHNLTVNGRGVLAAGQGAAADTSSRSAKRETRDESSGSGFLVGHVGVWLLEVR